ncbi:hypothetical protein [Gymnodinialimonas ulvae]|uniref:hypothetical protein n=1 Tax=Gymnodinialimonas ulvae TaxID=3126504 RepID=UPI0030AF8E3D
MTEFRTFEASDAPWTAIGFAFGIFYGAMFIFLFAFWGLDGMLLLFIIGLPFLAVQLILYIGVDRFAKWRHRDVAPKPPTAWLRHHSISFGSAIGASLALVWVFAAVRL